MVFFNSETIEKHVSDEDVEEKALRIAAQKHEESHKNGEHHTEVREKKSGLSKEEEHVIDEIKKQTDNKDDKYTRATAEQANATYGRATADEKGSGYGGHNHGSVEASCTCGWRSTPHEAMNDMLHLDGGKKGGMKYEAHTAGIKYNESTSLEDMTSGGYSSPMDNMQYH
jgi:hypothetical protein